CIRKDGKRPKWKQGGQEQIMTSWIGRQLRPKEHAKCMNDEYAPLRHFSWWNEAVDNLLNEPKQKLGFAAQTTTKSKATYIAKWCMRNGGSKPKHKQDDTEEHTMASWIGKHLKRGKHMKCMSDEYAPLSKFTWWNEAVDNLLKEPKQKT